MKHTIRRSAILFLLLFLLFSLFCPVVSAEGIADSTIKPVDPLGPIVPADPVEPEEPEITVYTPSTAVQARYVPTYIYRNVDQNAENGEEVQMLYNPETAKMAMELSVSAYNIHGNE